MTKYAHVKDGAVYRIRDLTAEQIADIPAHKAGYILPYIEVARPVYDPATHHAPVRQPDVIGASDVTQVWTAPVAKTQQELDDAATAAQDSALLRTDRPNSIERALMIAQYRQIKGTTPAGVADTPAAFRQYLRGLM